jgi:transketolase
VGLFAAPAAIVLAKPIDVPTVSEAAAATSGRIVVAEDHHPEGGLGSAVTECLLSSGRTSLHVAHLAVSDMPGSGTGEELMAWPGIDADHIAAAARGLVRG